MPDHPDAPVGKWIDDAPPPPDPSQPLWVRRSLEAATATYGLRHLVHQFEALRTESSLIRALIKVGKAVVAVVAMLIAFCIAIAMSLMWQALGVTGVVDGLDLLADAARVLERFWPRTLVMFGALTTVTGSAWTLGRLRHRMVLWWSRRRMRSS